jgi:hypothetical protein
MDVLGIRVRSINDLLRLAVSIKREKAVVITYPTEKGLYEAGIYLPPFSKELSAVYPYLVTDKKLHPVYSYSSNEAGGESIREGMVRSSLYLPVYTAFLKEIPHRYVDLDKVKYEITVVELEDLSSLVNLSISILDSWMYIPFVWYDVDNETFVLSLEVTPRDDVPGELLVLNYEHSNLPNDINFIAYEQENGRIELTNGFKGLNYQYISVIKTYALPYFR